jgi:hypothetical protein
VGRRLSLYGLVIVWAERTPYTPRSPCVLCRLFSSAACQFSPIFPPFFARFLIIALSLSLFVLHHASHSFLGIALYIKTCPEPHRIRTTHVPSTGLVFLVFPLLIFFLPLCLPQPVPFLGAFACSRGGGRCFVLSCSCLVLPCLVAFQVDRSPISLSVSSFVVYPFLS